MAKDPMQWLLAQLDEDEGAAKAAALTEGLTGSLVDYLKHESMQVDVAPSEAHYARHTPVRVLREIDAKRRTLIRCQEAMCAANPMLVHFAQQTVREMALSYVDRSGYPEEWRP